MIPSLKKGSLFNLKTVQTNPPPSLKSIYRKYLKSSLQAYKKCNFYIGSYLFKLLQHKRTNLEKQYQRIKDIKEYIELLQQNKADPAKPSKGMFKKFASPHLQQTLIRLRLHHSHLQRITHQHLLSDFQDLYHLTTVLHQSLTPSNHPDLRTAQMSKLIRLAFNVSQFFTPTLLPRHKYQSLLILDSLENDMQFEGLKEEDKEFARNVVIRVFGKNEFHYTKFKNVKDYLADQNALHLEIKKQKVEIGKVKAKSTNKTREQMHKTREQMQTLQQAEMKTEFKQGLDEQAEELQQKQYTDQWSILNQADRNRAVKHILISNNPLNKSTQTNTQTNNTTFKLLNKHITPKTLLFQLLHNLNLTQSIYESPTQLDQVHQICRRLFKLKSSSEDHAESSQHQTNIDPQILKLPLLDDAILDLTFIDEFVNMKKMILV